MNMKDSGKRNKSSIPTFGKYTILPKVEPKYYNFTVNYHRNQIMFVDLAVMYVQILEIITHI